MYARFTRLTQWEGRIQQLPPPPVTQWSIAGRRLSLCRCNNGQGIEGGTVGAFWCITFISPRGTLARDATMRSDTSSLFVVAVQENLPPTLDPMNMGFHPLSRRILPCRVHRSVHPSSLLPGFHPLETSPRCKRGFEMSGGIEAIKIGQRSYCWNFIRKKLNLVHILEKLFSFLIFVQISFRRNVQREGVLIIDRIIGGKKESVEILKKSKEKDPSIIEFQVWKMARFAYAGLRVMALSIVQGAVPSSTPRTWCIAYGIENKWWPGQFLSEW